METDEFGIPIIRCQSAEQLMAELNEIHSRWKDGTWIFRGQNDASRTLLPSSMRGWFQEEYVSCYPPRFPEELVQELERESGFPHQRPDRWNTTFLQNRAELEIVLAFEVIADQVGLAIPNDRFAPMGQRMTDPVNDLLHNMQELGIEPPAESPSDVVMYQPTSLVVALAQHHGIPTRLLDWTLRPYTAAFFAQYGLDSGTTSSSCRPESDYMVVWAVKVDELHHTSLRLVTHLGRRSQIGFLYAQDGVFLYDETANGKYIQDGQWQPFEAELIELSSNSAVYKLLLHHSRQEKLLELLTRKKISKSYLMPSFDNAAKEAKSGRYDDWNEILNLEGNERL